jgi:DNA processing protein
MTSSLLRRGSRSYPAELEHLAAPPSCLYVLGDLARADARRVAIVGTRRASRVGREIAAELGFDLARAGLCVVSGLARGIDGAAHRGALDASRVASGVPGPLAVVGSGLDVVYPAEHRDLWEAVAAAGAVVSELGPGTPPLPHHFPARNRLIAALAEVVVVVESAERGGSLVTARLALDLGRTVLAVPGSVRAPANRGTNLLLRDGASPVLDVSDVLGALGLAAPPVPAARRPERPAGALARRVGALLAAGPAAPESLADQLAAHPLELTGAIEELARLGLVEQPGLWWELTAAGAAVEW